MRHWNNIRQTLTSPCGSDLLYTPSNVGSVLHVWLGLHEPPTLRDADEGCHQHSPQCSGLNEAAVDCAGKQTELGLVGVWRGGIVVSTPMGGLQSIEFCLSHTKSGQCQQRRRKEKPRSRPPRATSGVETSERLPVGSHTRLSKLDWGWGACLNFKRSVFDTAAHSFEEAAHVLVCSSMWSSVISHHALVICVVALRQYWEPGSGTIAFSGQSKHCNKRKKELAEMVFPV